MIFWVEHLFIFKITTEHKTHFKIIIESSSMAGICQMHHIASRWVVFQFMTLRKYQQKARKFCEDYTFELIKSTVFSSLTSMWLLMMISMLRTAASTEPSMFILLEYLCFDGFCILIKPEKMLTFKKSKVCHMWIKISNANWADIASAIFWHC